MQKQIAFLRGINVGNIRIKMPDLKASFEKLGFTNVKTYLQTGNVVYDSDNTISTNKPIIEQNLTQTFNYEAYVLLYEFDSLAKIINEYPFEREENYHAYIIFIENISIFEDLSSLSKTVNEPISVGNQVIYWKVRKGESLDTPFSKLLAKAKYKSSTTVRNINTLEKMAEDN